MKYMMGITHSKGHICGNRFGEIYLLSPIYGSGFHTSKDILNTYMHNDYLEYLVSYGLIGGVFFNYT